MHIRNLAFFFLCTSAAANFLGPLDFEKIRQDNVMSNLLQNTTLLFHDVQSLNLVDEKALARIVTRQIDLIGAIYIFKYQPNLLIWHEDLLYLDDLIDRIYIEFEILKNDQVAHQLQFISQLFLQIKLLVKGCIEKATTQNPSQLFR